MSKRFLKFMQDGQPLVIDQEDIGSIRYSEQKSCWAVAMKHSISCFLNDDNAKRLLKHISSDCFDLFDKPEKDF